jgi:RNA polymerase sigma-70 factor, ECF subfamily
MHTPAGVAASLTQSQLTFARPAAATTAGSWRVRAVAFYDRLAALAPDPVVDLNRVVAIAMTGDVDGGLARVDALADALDRYHYFHAARADLLRRCDAHDAAADAYARALELAGNGAERAFLERRLADIA